MRLRAVPLQKFDMYKYLHWCGRQRENRRYIKWKKKNSASDSFYDFGAI